MRMLSAMVLAVTLLLASCGGSADDEGTDAPRAEVPGGNADHDVLPQETWFDDAGRLYFPKIETHDEDKQQAQCDFLFGTVDEVAQNAQLDGEVSLLDDSGFTVLGGNGTGFICSYAVSGTPALSMRVWDKDLDQSEYLDTSDDDLHVVDLKTDSGYYGVSIYDGDVTDGIPDSGAEEWLQAAATRVHPPAE